jgi:hypothetical protein
MKTLVAVLVVSGFMCASAPLVAEEAAANSTPEVSEKVAANAALKGRFNSSRQHHILLQVMQSSVTVNNATLSNVSSKVAIDFFTSRNLAVELGYFSMQTSAGTTLLSGLEASTKWYPFSPGTESFLYRDDITIRSFANMGFYGGIGYRLRTFYLGERQLGVSGFGLTTGYDWNFGRAFTSSFLQALFFNAEVAYDNLSSTNETRLSVLSFALGLGARL